MEDFVDDVLHFLPIIKAAMRRVHVFNHLTETEFEVESLYQLRTVRLTKKGYIHWRRFPLGIMLFEALVEAQNWRCCYCGVHMELGDDNKHHCYPTIEHVRARDHGGSDHPDNLAIACFWCNMQRNNMPVQHYLRLVRPYVSG